jgi:hypothetical protein
VDDPVQPCRSAQRAVVRDMLARGGPNDTYGFGGGHVSTVRRLLVDMIEEYARTPDRLTPAS